MKKSRGKQIEKAEQNPFSKESIKKAFIAGRLTPERISKIVMDAFDELEKPLDKIYAGVAIHKNMLPSVSDPVVQKVENSIYIGFDPDLFPQMKNVDNNKIIDITPELSE